MISLQFCGKSTHTRCILNSRILHFLIKEQHSQRWAVNDINQLFAVAFSRYWCTQVRPLLWEIYSALSTEDVWHYVAPEAKSVCKKNGKSGRSTEKEQIYKKKTKRRYFKCSRDIILTWESDVFVWIKTITMWYFLLVDIYPYLWGAVYEVRDSCHTSFSVLLARGIVTFVFGIHSALAMPYLWDKKPVFLGNLKVCMSLFWFLCALLQLNFSVPQ